MTAQSDEVEIHRRFRGPPTSGNGGYVAGVVAEWIDRPARVDLLAPIPLEVPLHRRRDDAEVMLFDAARNYAQRSRSTRRSTLPCRATERGGAGGGGDELSRAVGPSHPGMFRVWDRAGAGGRPLHLSRRKPASRRGGGGMGAGRGTGRRAWPCRGALPLGGARLPQLFRPVRTAAAGVAGAAVGVARAAGHAGRTAEHYRLGTVARGPQASQRHGNS